LGLDALVLFFVACLLLVGGGIAFSLLVAPRSENKVKLETYECGIETEGPSWLQFKVGYYLFAILFLIFDVETVFLFPWAVVMKKLGMVAFIEILVFLTILTLGLVYAWKKGALKWE